MPDPQEITRIRLELRGLVGQIKSIDQRLAALEPEVPNTPSIQPEDFRVFLDPPKLR